jgi:hypothetical protein
MGTTRQTATTVCQHRWLIQPANGPTSQGECRLCGERRTFANNPDLARIDAKSHLSA